MSAALSTRERKALGVYYTHEDVVEHLVRWGLKRPALRRAQRSVLDPSCGDGRFLVAAARNGAVRLVGCDVDPEGLAITRRSLGSTGLETRFLEADFFAVEPETVEPVDLVVGNPPFIRYQRFTGESRRRALASALRLGVRLTRLTSSWAPFLLHATRFLKPGGDMAMVVPAEVLQTFYGRETLQALVRRFESVELVAFERNFFDDAQEETCLLLAEGHGGSCREVRLLPLASIGDLREAEAEAAVRLPMGDEVRFAEAFLKEDERRAWRRVKRHEGVRTIASLGDVANGYVTGDNKFFHRTRRQAEASGYPETWLFPVGRSSKSLRGASFTVEDIEALEECGSAHHLVVPQEDLFDADGVALERFRREGEELGVPERFKCRTRRPWWKVPGLAAADVLLAYMIGSSPRAAVNRCGAFHSNSLHGLRLRDGVSAELLVLSFYSSLTLLSLEIEGRSYGGGVLKLEPREMDRVLVAWPEEVPAGLLQAFAEMEEALRGGSYDVAVAVADEVLLRGALGLSKRRVRLLRAARRRLVERRSGRSRRPTQFTE